eukprot:gene7576-11900_t
MKKYTRSSLLHVGVSSSKGMVCNFDDCGYRCDKTGWDWCINIPIPDDPIQKNHLTDNEWDLLLEDFTNNCVKNGKKYHSLNNNCFTFAVDFLNSIRFLGSNNHTKEDLVENFINKPILNFELFLDIYDSLDGKSFIYENDLKPKNVMIAMCDFCSDIIQKNHRFHCTVCSDYDLCQKCYKSNKSNGKHKSNHKMSKK